MYWLINDDYTKMSRYETYHADSQSQCQVDKMYMAAIPIPEGEKNSFILLTWSQGPCQ